MKGIHSKSTLCAVVIVVGLIVSVFSCNSEVDVSSLEVPAVSSKIAILGYSEIVVSISNSTSQEAQVGLLVTEEEKAPAYENVVSEFFFVTRTVKKGETGMNVYISWTDKYSEPSAETGILEINTKYYLHTYYIGDNNSPAIETQEFTTKNYPESVDASITNPLALYRELFNGISITRKYNEPYVFNVSVIRAGNRVQEGIYFFHRPMIVQVFSAQNDLTSSSTNFKKILAKSVFFPSDADPQYAQMRQRGVGYPFYFNSIGSRDFTKEYLFVQDGGDPAVLELGSKFDPNAPDSQWVYIDIKMVD